uniref:Uncharacterized protein n=1 Tax=Romanomermis culicivorax TaxID=13658 RepID=A0A915K8T4_ROMCU
MLWSSAPAVIRSLPKFRRILSQNQSDGIRLRRIKVGTRSKSRTKRKRRLDVLPNGMTMKDVMKINLVKTEKLRYSKSSIQCFPRCLWSKKPSKNMDCVKIGSYTKHDLVLRIKSSGTEAASSGTELHPVEPIIQTSGNNAYATIDRKENKKLMFTDRKSV